MAAATMSSKPTLVRIDTNSSTLRAAKSAFPSELSALSEDTPISAHPFSAAALGPLTAPIVPPPAYADFLTRIATSSPTVRQGPMAAVSLSFSSRSRIQMGGNSGRRSMTSAPTSPPTSSAMSDCSCKRVLEEDEDDDEDDEDDDLDDDEISTDEDEDEDLPDAADHVSVADEMEDDRSSRGGRTTPVPDPLATPTLPSAPFTPEQKTPTTASSSRPATFPSLQIPPSPSFSPGGSSARGSPMASPYSATFSATSPSFPYDAEMAKMKLQWDPSSRPSAKTVRYRSVVTHTITYTPKLSPAPVSKRRRVE